VSGRVGEETKAMALDAAAMQRIARVAPADAEMMRQHPTTATIESLPFYGRYRWVRVVISLETHPIAFDYADDGTRAVVLGGTPEYIYRLNREEGLRLTQDQVAPYVRFFFAITGDEGDTLVEQSVDAPWLPATETDEALMAARAAASERVRPLRVSASADGYRVVAHVVQERQLVEWSLSVARDGQVDVLSTTVLIERIPVSLLM
jgi:hypothetical protein